MFVHCFAAFTNASIRIRTQYLLYVTPLQHVDGAGKVDGSIVVALPIDRWSAPEEVNAFEGGGLTFWDGRQRSSSTASTNTTTSTTTTTTTAPCEIHYDTRSGDVAFIDRYVVWCRSYY
jgi:hypothetical protein